MPNIPLNVPEELQASINWAAQHTRLNKAETMRQAIRLGLPVLIEKWPRPATPQPREAQKRGGS